MITTLFTRFAKDESGAAMVEYVVALLVVVAIGIGVMTTIGQNANAITDATCSGLAAGVSAATLTSVACP